VDTHELDGEILVHMCWETSYLHPKCVHVLLVCYFALQLNKLAPICFVFIHYCCCCTWLVCLICILVVFHPLLLYMIQVSDCNQLLIKVIWLSMSFFKSRSYYEM